MEYLLLNKQDSMKPPAKTKLTIRTKNAISSQQPKRKIRPGSFSNFLFSREFSRRMVIVGGRIFRHVRYTGILYVSCICMRPLRSLCTVCMCGSLQFYMFWSGNLHFHVSHINIHRLQAWQLEFANETCPVQNRVFLYIIFEQLVRTVGIVRFSK